MKNMNAFLFAFFLNCDPRGPVGLAHSWDSTKIFTKQKSIKKQERRTKLEGPHKTFRQAQAALVFISAVSCAARRSLKILVRNPRHCQVSDIELETVSAKPQLQH